MVIVFGTLGKSQDNRANIAKISKTLLWLFDEEKQDAINLKSNR